MFAFTRLAVIILNFFEFRHIFPETPEGWELNKSAFPRSSRHKGLNGWRKNLKPL